MDEELQTYDREPGQEPPKFIFRARNPSNDPGDSKPFVYEVDGQQLEFHNTNNFWLYPYAYIRTLHPQPGQQTDPLADTMYKFLKEKGILIYFRKLELEQPELYTELQKAISKKLEVRRTKEQLSERQQEERQMSLSMTYDFIADKMRTAGHSFDPAELCGGGELKELS